MGRLLEPEMQGVIFRDPELVENFLSVGSTRLQAVLKDREGNLDAFRSNGYITWAADGSHDTDQLLNVPTEPIPARCDDMAGAKPDLALFDEATRHWETARTPIEAKEQATHFKTRMK
ncbi:hypothetical protein FRC12_008322 [Ceratobasidium sp. 428]|nr:hypothetical protein FRC12_008322 [Ceratobasidium sp. 428]